MAVMSLGSLVLLLTTIVHAVASDRNTVKKELRKIVNNPLFYPSLAWILVIAVSLATTGFRDVPVTVRAGDFKKITFVIIPFILMFSLNISGIDFERFFRRWSVVFVIYAVIGIIQFFHPFARIQAIPNTSFWHATGTMGHHLSYSGAMMFPLFYIFSNVLKPGENFSRLEKTYWAIAFLLTAVAIFFSFSRMGWIAMFAGITIVTAIRFGKKGIATILILTVAAGAALSLSSSFRERMKDQSWKSERGIVWEAHYMMFRDFPVLGVGWQKNFDLIKKYEEERGLIEKYGRRFHAHAHNIFLNVLSTTGIAGLCIFLAYLFFLFRSSYAVFKSGNHRWGLALLGALLSFILAGLTQWNYGDAKVGHSLAWAIGILLFMFQQSNGEKNV